MNVYGGVVLLTVFIPGTFRMIIVTLLGAREILFVKINGKLGSSICCGLMICLFLVPLMMRPNSGVSWNVMNCYVLWGRMRIGPLPTHIICDNILIPWLSHSRYLRSNWGFTPKDLGYSKVRCIDSQVFHQGPGVVSSPWPDCCIGCGKRLHNYGKSPFLWENSLWMAIFNSYVKFERCWPCHVFRLWLRYLYLFTSVAMRWAAPRTPWAIVISAFNFFFGYSECLGVSNWFQSMKWLYNPVKRIVLDPM